MVNITLGMLKISIQGYDDIPQDYPRQAALLLSISNVEIFESSWIILTGERARHSGIELFCGINTQDWVIWRAKPKSHLVSVQDAVIHDI
jgi:hypothetical protein